MHFAVLDPPPRRSQFHELLRQRGVGGDSWVTHGTYPSVCFFSFEFDVGCNRRDKESAMFLGPGMYLIENL